MLEIWAHRGSHSESGPLENTLSAFQLAMDEGADGIELDVHLSSDRVPIVFHDETLTRLSATGDARIVHEVGCSELGRLPLVQGGRIPRLEDVLDLVAGKLRLNIEIKDETAVGAVMQTLAAAVYPSESVIISSFSIQGVAAAGAVDGDLTTAWINGDSPRGLRCQLDRRWPFVTLANTSAHRWHPHYALPTAHLMAAARDRGIDVCCWTVNELELALRLASLGVTGVFTDTPGLLRSQLESATHQRR